MKHILFFDQIRRKHVPIVGGKTASLGELMSIKMPVPGGFAVTASAYRHFIKYNKLDSRIEKILKFTDVKKIGKLKKAGNEIRTLIKNAEFQPKLEKQILQAFDKLGEKYVAVRSSATAEDLPSASFAGQQESFLNVDKRNLLEKIKDCFASLFTDRAISYREDKGFNHFRVLLSVAVQKQIFSKASGVMFTIEPDSGHKNFIMINAGFGLGDYIVQGKITPDEFWVFKENCRLVGKKIGTKEFMEIRSIFGVKKKRLSKTMQDRFSISDSEAETLAELGKKIEKHYRTPMDIEWAKDEHGIHILQARSETVHSTKKTNEYTEYRLKEKSKILAKGLAIGRKISSGKVCIIKNVKNISKFRQGQILVTAKTDPDWEPIMKIAAGIVTEEGSRTAHAAIVSRELGIPAIVGVKNATKIFKRNQLITLDCTQETGLIWKGALKFAETKHNIKKMPRTRTRIYVNIGEPEQAIDASLLPVDGVGLAREEFILGSHIGIHPLELIRKGRQKEFINKLASGIGKIAASFYPRAVIVRTSDFKTNEYRNLKGGRQFEPEEDNPMLGWRGASRYITDYEPAFRLECKALKKVIGEFGLKNIKVMIPFCRTIEEAKNVLKIIKDEKLKAEIGVMAEVPSNILLAEEFAKLFKFFSIGSNDLTQLTLGIDRDNETLAKEFDERNEAVKKLIEHLIKTTHKHRRSVGICGDAPSTFPEFTKFLIKNRIDSVSVTPDVAVSTRLLIAKYEKK